MRFCFLAVIGLVFIAGPVLAQQSSGGGQLGKRPVLGSYTCKQAVPCDANDAVSAAQWAQYGDACVKSAFGYSNPDGFIDDSAGLDSTNCLTSRPGSIPKGPGQQLSPLCCVVQTQANVCVLHCDLVQQ